MTRLVLACAVAAAALSSGCVAPDPLVCRRADVLQKVDALLHQSGRTVAIDPRTVGEQSVGTGRAVSCAVQAHILGYETNHDGIRPIETLFVVHYALDLRQNGIFVRLDEAPQPALR